MLTLTLEIGITWLAVAWISGMWLGRIIRQHMNTPLAEFHPVPLSHGNLAPRSAARSL